GVTGGPQEAHHRTHRVAQQTDAGVADTAPREGDRSGELLDLTNAQSDRHLVAARHTPVGVAENIEALAPERDRDAQEVMPPALVTRTDHDPWRRAGLAEEPGTESDPIRRRKVDLLVVGLELPGREEKVVQELGGRGHEEAPVENDRKTRVSGDREPYQG